MTDEAKAMLEALALECDANVASASKGAEHYGQKHGHGETVSFFQGEKNAWRQAARMLRDKAKA